MSRKRRIGKSVKYGLALWAVCLPALFAETAWHFAGWIAATAGKPWHGGKYINNADAPANAEIRIRYDRLKRVTTV
jgi:hypothetical protein